MATLSSIRKKALCSLKKEGGNVDLYALEYMQTHPETEKKTNQAQCCT